MKLGLNKSVSARCLRCLGGAITLTFATGLHAQTTTNTQPVRLPEVLIQAEAEASGTVQAPFLPDVQGTKINAGKKTSVIDLDQIPQVVNNNYRQALSQTPGLLLSEETTPLVSIGYRGLNPHRAQFTQVLKDGIPIHADMLGYPEAYYTPPLDTVDRIEFLHGGASLMYGPQPGGALNYVTHMPRTDKEFSARSQHIFGSDNLYSTFNSVDGTIGRLGYYAYFNHRQTDGFRTANSDYDLYAGSAKLVLDAQTDSRWIFTFDGYQEEHGEPGGLSFTAGPNYSVDRDAATRFNDRFSLERYFASLAYEKDFSETTQLTVQAWGGYYQRFSKRQTGGGFGTIAAGAGNTIENQEFYTKGIEARLRHDWEMGENVHTLAGGLMVYHTDSPRVDKAGATPNADDGAITTQSDRSILYAPVFVENKFQFGKFSVTPGLRVENYVQDVQNFTTGRQVEDREIVPLVGLGLAYAVTENSTTYANVSQAYRPKIFTESVPQAGGTTVAADLDPGKSWQYEIGYRGQLDSYFAASIAAGKAPWNSTSSA
jgi:Fe(3+) dicitrate transport protein